MANDRTQLWQLLLSVMIAIALAMVVLFPLLLSVFVFRDSTPRGPLTVSSDWPETIRDIHAKMVDAGIDVDGFEVFLVHAPPGDAINCTVLCRMPESDRAIEVLRAALGMKEVSADKLPYLDSVKRDARFVPPDWWPTSDSMVEYFGSRGVINGDEGELYVVAHDPQQRRIIIHYYYNF